MYIYIYVYIYIYIYVGGAAAPADGWLADVPTAWPLSRLFFFANFADGGEHSLVKTNVYYTRLAEPIGKM